MDPELVKAVLADWKTAPVDERFRAALKLSEAMTLRPSEVDSDFVHELEAGGLDRGEIEEVASVVFNFNLFNRIADALNFPLPEAKHKPRLARALSLVSRLLTGGPTPSPSWARAKDGLIRPAELDAAREQLLGYSGSIKPELRASIEAYVAALWGATRPAAELSDVLEAYLKPLSLHAYRIHDALVQDMIAAGYSESQVFEMTLIGAVGAALPAQEQLFRVLYGREGRARTKALPSGTNRPRAGS